VSRSHFITASHATREQILARVRSLVESHPDLSRAGTFDMPYRTYCFRFAAVRLDPMDCWLGVEVGQHGALSAAKGCHHVSLSYIRAA
jgi:hypothetical protein